MKTIKLGYPIRTATDSEGHSVVIPWFFGVSNPVKDEYSLEIFNRLKEHAFNLKDAGLDDGHFYQVRNLGLHKYDSCFEAKPYTYFISQKELFWVPLEVSWHPDAQREDMFKYLSCKLPEDLRNYIHSGKAKVLFYSMFEGFITKSCYEAIEQFCKINGLTRETAWVITANLNTAIIPRLSNRHFGVKLMNYFADDLWFRCNSKKEDFEESNRKIQSYYADNKYCTKPKRFLCLNRRWDNHRAFMVGFLRSQPELSSKSIISLGIGDYGWEFGVGKDGYDASSCFSDSAYFPQVSDYYRENWLKNILSCPDNPGDPKILANRVDLNERLYRTTDINIITETHYLTKDINFFSEKTFKSIFCLQPFILVTTPGSLDTLRKTGYRTFDRWWDESYDGIVDPTKRMDKICKLVQLLGLKSQEEIREIVKDMNETLYYNARLLISSCTIDSTLDFLRMELNPKTTVLV